jgi:uncharacterized membrane protein
VKAEVTPMWLEFFKSLLEKHPGKVTGSLVGLFLGILIVTLGFFKTLFIGICLCVGLVAGIRADESGGWITFFEKIWGKDR